MPEITSTASMSHAELQALLEAVLVDMTAIRTAVVGITAKLDADAGVTDTDYASSLDPAALTVTT